MRISKITALVIAISITPSIAFAEEAPKNDEIKHKFSIEGGINKTSGNAESENFRGELSLISTLGKYENEFQATGNNQNQNGVREEEYYKVENQLNREISKMQFVFGKLIYEDDRFAGIDYRASQLVGVGHKFYDDADFKLSTKLGVGARQTEFIDPTAEDEESVLGSVGGDLFWKINENVEFTQSLDLNFTEANTETVSETAFKAFMDKNLYLKFSYEVRNNSDVPTGIDKTDTQTIFTVGYQFGE